MLCIYGMGKGETGGRNGLRESEKTPHKTYTSHPIPIEHHLSYPPLHTNIPPTLSPRLERRFGPLANFSLLCEDPALRVVY